MSILLKNGHVVTVNDARAVFEGGFVTVGNDGRITAVGPAEDCPTTPFGEVIDCGGMIVLPGLINLHQHHWHVLLKGRALVGAAAPHRVRARVSATDLRLSSYLSAMEMIRTGTTCCLNHSVTDTRELEVAATIEPMAEVGLRQVFAKEFRARTPAMPDYPMSADEAADETRQHIERWHGTHDGLVRMALAVEAEAPFAVAGAETERLIARGYALARQHGLRITSHASGRAVGGRSSIMHLMELGVLDERWLLVHATHASDTDISLMREAGSHAIYAPTSEAIRGEGIGPIAKLLARGVNCALGTDGAIGDGSVDMVEQMKAAVFLQNTNLLDPSAMSSETALEMATINAARALDLAGEVGSLEPGKRADISAFDGRGPHMQVTHKRLSTFVCTGRGGDARLVIVDGQIVLRDGKLMRGPRLDEMFEEAARLSRGDAAPEVSRPFGAASTGLAAE
jgi:5-methylthioadenosine/S-adenosylhomocysteine deaminase